MGSRFVRLGWTLALVVLALAVQPAVVRSQAAAPFGPFPPATQAALQRIVDQHLTEVGAPGVAAGVWLPGRGSWVHAQGTADTATNVPFAVDDKFRIASITKTFVATVVLQLVDEGAIRLDDRLEQYVTGIPNGDRITIQQVLGMTAGIFSYTEDATFLADYAANPLMPFSPEDVLAIVRRHPPDFAPGERFHYSDSNYTLLGLIIEQVTGQTPGDAIAARIVQPLRLTGTSFPIAPDLPEPYTHGYNTEPNGAGLRDVTRSNPAVAWTAGAMVSTLDDLRLWVRALATGVLLSPAVQRERLQGTTIPMADGAEARYGLGLFSIVGFIGHNGGIPGYSSIAVHLPDANATLVVLVNKSGLEGGEADAILWDMAKLLFPERFPNS